MPHSKTILITGASDGIGLALARKCLAEGFNVIGTARSGTISQLESSGLMVLQLDVTNEASIEAAAKQLQENNIRIDILVNNAGVGVDLGTPVPERESFELTLNTNVTGLVLFAESIIGLVPENGQVLNISSKLGSIALRPHINSTAYRISKAGINMYTNILAERLRPKHINVISVHPGWVNTKLSTKGAPLSTEASAEGIFKLIQSKKRTATFWNAEDQQELPW